MLHANAENTIIIKARPIEFLIIVIFQRRA